MARIGILTGGGDCPGLNAVIRAVVRAGVCRTITPSSASAAAGPGSWRTRRSSSRATSTAGLLTRGGTILGTSRTNPYADGADGSAAVQATLERRGIDALIPIGGDDTLGVALRLHEEGVPVVGVPKTIDNDLGGTDSRSASRRPCRS